MYGHILHAIAGESEGAPSSVFPKMTSKNKFSGDANLRRRTSSPEMHEAFRPTVRTAKSIAIPFHRQQRMCVCVLICSYIRAPNKNKKQIKAAPITIIIVSSSSKGDKGRFTRRHAFWKKEVMGFAPLGMAAVAAFLARSAFARLGSGLLCFTELRLTINNSKATSRGQGGLS